MVITEVEIELNRAWLMDEKGKTIGETNFVVTDRWLREVYKKDFYMTYSNYEDFLDTYEPEVDGQRVYEKALAENALVENIGEQLYVV